MLSGSLLRAARLGGKIVIALGIIIEKDSADMFWPLSFSGGDRFSSTQATVLSLKAIIAYEEARAAAMSDLSVDVVLDGVHLGSLAAKAGDQVSVYSYRRGAWRWIEGIFWLIW